MRVCGGCHCGTVRFEAEVSEDSVLLDCNCSICAMTGFRHLIVPADRFRLLGGEDHLSEYRFGSGTARHLFCRSCGVKSFYIPRSHPDGISINARTLDAPVDLPAQPFDGRNWEAARARLAS